MTYEQFSGNDFKELEKETKNAHNALKKAQEEMREKRKEEITDTLVNISGLTHALQEALDDGEISSFMKAEDVLGFFEEKRKDLLVEIEDLGSGKQSKDMDVGDVDSFETFQREQAAIKKEVSLSALKSILNEEMQENRSIQNMKVADYMKYINDKLAVLRKNYNDLDDL